jgi:hypothetical protein
MFPAAAVHITSVKEYVGFAACLLFRKRSQLQFLGHPFHWAPPFPSVRKTWSDIQIKADLMLLFENQRWSAGALPMEVNGYLNTVGDPDEGNAAIHPIIFAVKCHCPLDLTCARSLAGNR